MLGDKIKDLRKKHGYSQTQTAIKLNVTQGAVSQWENNITVPAADQLSSIADVFGISVDELLGRDTKKEPIIISAIPIRHHAVPVVGAIACGKPITAEEQVEGYTDLPDGINADFALRCQGDSMMPLIHDGDLVLVRSQPDVEDGQIAVVIQNDEATLKHVYHMTPNTLLLVAENPAFPPIHASAEPDGHSIIQGLAVGYVRMYK